MKTINLLFLFTFSLPLYGVCPDGKTYPVALTFDDGPDEKLTPMVLNALRDEKVPGTFFVKGELFEGGRSRKENRVKYAILDRMKRDGHIIGSHTYHHLSHPQKSDDWIRRNLTRSNPLIGEYLAPIVRLPYGAGALRGRTPEERARNEQVMDIVKKTDLTHVLWDVDSRDWELSTPEQIKEKVLKDICRYKGKIILFHDIQPITAHNIRFFINAIKDEGHPIVGLEEFVPQALLKLEAPHCGPEEHPPGILDEIIEKALKKFEKKEN